jgi:hypothetical protein
MTHSQSFDRERENGGTTDARCCEGTPGSSSASPAGPPLPPPDTDLSFLDDPRILAELFPLGYMDYGRFGASGSEMIHGRTGFFEVEQGVRLGWGFWVKSLEAPTLLYFHGNGETVADYDWFAPAYLERGMNLFVIDYRGYGKSSGEPTFVNTLSDARTVFAALRRLLAEEGFRDSVFVMGRSIGSIPACELAAHHDGEFRGLIIESGAANNFRYRWRRHLPRRENALGEDGVFLNKVKLRGYGGPLLLLHGLHDAIVPFSEAEENHRNAGSPDKRLVSIEAGHNDIMSVDGATYFGAIEEFVEEHDLPSV